MLTKEKSRQKRKCVNNQNNSSSYFRLLTLYYYYIFLIKNLYLHNPWLKNGEYFRLPEFYEGVLACIR